MMAHILIIEDAALFRKFLTTALKAESYKVSSLDDADGAIPWIKDVGPDLILLDVMLKTMDGIAFCRRLKSLPETRGIPVILMSGSKVGEEEQATGHEIGADDYLVKPFSSRLLLAKVRSVLNRRRPDASTDEIHVLGELRVDCRARLVEVAGKRIGLTRKEYDLLQLFLSESGAVLSAQTILDKVWGIAPEVEVDSRTVTVHVSSLRQKIGPSVAKRIVTLSGVGYRFDR